MNAQISVTPSPRQEQDHPLRTELWYLFLWPELYVQSLEEFRFPQVHVLRF